jgi:hypothetical protein
MQLLIDLIFNHGVFYGEPFYYQKFSLREIRDLINKLDVPSEIFIVNGPFFISGYRKALMFSKAISLLYNVPIYGFDLLRDYGEENDCIRINEKTFIKNNGHFYIQTEDKKSETNYSLFEITKNLDNLRLPHDNILLDWK